MTLMYIIDNSKSPFIIVSIISINSESGIGTLNKEKALLGAFSEYYATSLNIDVTVQNNARADPHPRVLARALPPRQRRAHHGELGQHRGGGEGGVQQDGAQQGQPHR